jgi:hypothetical protein
MSPVPPPSTVAPYDSLESCLNLTRVRVNDAIANIGGDILTDTQPFTSVMVNAGWRKLQAFLANLGYSRLKQTFIAYALPAVASTDPASQTLWSWTQFFDGVAYWAPPTVTTLPQDFILPLRLWERQTGSNQIFSPLRMAPDGLPQGYKIPWNRWFEWREDALYMPGSSTSMDLRVEYAAYLGDFTTTNGTLDSPSAQVVPIMRAQSALANYIAAECAAPRDDMDAGKFVTDAESDARMIFNTEVKLKQRTPVQRKAYARGSSWRLNSYSGY